MDKPRLQFLSMKTIRHLHYRYLYMSGELDTRSLYFPALSVEAGHPGEQRTDGKVNAYSQDSRFSEKMVPCILSAWRKDQEASVKSGSKWNSGYKWGKKSSLRTCNLDSEVHRKFFVTGAKSFSAFCTAMLVRGLGMRGKFWGESQDRWPKPIKGIFQTYGIVLIT